MRINKIALRAGAEGLELAGRSNLFAVTPRAATWEQHIWQIPDRRGYQFGVSQ